ncbi:MAG TPA: transposase [Ktedonobacteraceae bacterium]|nr:transposase [Ktedonobacteraceae bacterium]
MTVLLGLMECDGKRTLSGLLQEVGHPPSLSGLSRFFSEAPWSQEAIVDRWLSHFRTEMQPRVEAECEQQRQQPLRQRGRPKQPFVTGYVIGDDSTMSKHHSTTYDQRIVGHSLVQGCYMLLDRTCPLVPQLYQQEQVCEASGVPFHSKIALMETLIRTFEPVTGTRTHILLDSWYCAKCLWHAARERGFLMTTGMKSNRRVRVADETAPQGWGWQKLSDYAAQLSASGFVPLPWPHGGKLVWVHVVKTSVRKLYRCQVIIVRHSLDAPLSQTRYWASSNLDADAAGLLTHIAARWEIEILFEDGKEELGLDHYQVMSTTALLRFWTLALLAYVFLEEEQQRLCVLWQRPVSIGEARREIQRRHRRCLLEWLHRQFLSGVHPEALFDLLAA